VHCSPLFLIAPDLGSDSAPFTWAASSTRRLGGEGDRPSVRWPVAALAGRAAADRAEKLVSEEKD
jgi:hypothetical protein